LSISTLKHRPLPQSSNAIFATSCAIHCLVFSSVTAAAFTIVHRRHQTRLPAIATRCRSCQTPSLLPPPFTAFHCHIHQTPSNSIASFEHLRSPQMVVAAVGG
jgi:hypothetical protein